MKRILTLTILILSISLSVLPPFWAKARQTNSYHIVLENQSKHDLIMSIINRTECTRYSAPNKMHLARGEKQTLFLISSAVNCSGRFAVITLQIKRENEDDTQIIFDGELYGKGVLDSQSGGVFARCKPTGVRQGQSIYDYHCVLG